MKVKLIFLCATLSYSIGLTLGGTYHEVTLYEHPNFKGWNLTLDLSAVECWKLAPQHDKAISSLKVKCNCVALFDEDDCSGNPDRIFYHPPGEELPDFTDASINYDNKASSLRKCNQQEEEASKLNEDCGEGYVVYDENRCFRLIYEFPATNAAQSSELCKLSGAQLASIRDKDENTYLTDYISDLMSKRGIPPAESVRTAGVYSNGNWSWRRPGDTFSFANWGAGEPKFLSEGSILHLLFEQPRNPNWGKWGTVAADKPAYTLCMKIPKETKSPCAKCIEGLTPCEMIGQCPAKGNSSECMQVNKSMFLGILSECQGCDKVDKA